MTINNDKLKQMLSEATTDYDAQKQQKMRESVEKNLDDVARLFNRCTSSDSESTTFLKELNLKIETSYSLKQDKEGGYEGKNVRSYIDLGDGFILYIFRRSTYDVTVKLSHRDIEEKILKGVHVNSCSPLLSNQQAILALLGERDALYQAHIDSERQDFEKRQKDAAIEKASRVASQRFKDKYDLETERIKGRVEQINNRIKEDEKRLKKEKYAWLEAKKKELGNATFVRPLVMYRWLWQLSAWNEEGQELEYIDLYGFTDKLDDNGYVSLIREGYLVEFKPPANYPITIEKLEINSFADLPLELTTRDYEELPCLLSYPHKASPLLNYNRMKLPSLCEKPDPNYETTEVDGMLFRCDRVNPTFKVEEKKHSPYTFCLPPDADTSKYDNPLYERIWEDSTFELPIDRAVKPIQEYWDEKQSSN